ncbi:hypothetical protein MN116_001623, partial [Schistosoma mekongi]
MSELQCHSARGNRNETRLSLELTPYFKILQIVALHGSKGNSPINLNTFVLCFLQTVRDKDVISVHQGFFNTLCLFFLEAQSNTIVLEAKSRDGNCNSVSNQSKSTFAANLGWVCHLLRWLLCNVYTDISDWQEIALIIGQTIPDFLKLIFDGHQNNFTFSTNLDIADKSKEMDPSHPYNALQFYSEAWTKEPSWDSLSLASSFTTLSSSQHHKYRDAVEGNAVKTTDQTKVYYPASIDLAYAPHFFLTDQLPKLCSDSSSLNIVNENTDLYIHQEIVCLWRWMFIFCHYKQSFRPLTKYEENCSGSSVLLKYLLQEFKSITSRLSFQNEDTCWKTIIGLRNFFSLLAAVLMVEFGKNASDHNNKSEFFSEFFQEQVKYDTSEYQREPKKARSEVDSNPGTFVSTAFLLGTLVNLANSDTKFSCLWWLVMDWIIRFMWQNTFIMRSEGNKYELLNEIETLLVIVSGSIKVKRIPLANECLVTMMHTLVVLLNYEIRQGLISHIPLNSALSAYNEIWEFSACLFEQCSIQRNRLQGHKREGSLSGYRFLNHDRLVCNLLSALFCLHNSVRNNHFNCPNISNICLRIFTSLMKCLDLDTSHLNSSPWRIRLIVLSSTYMKLPQGLIPCDIFNVSTIPNILLFNLGIIFLLYNYVKIWNTEDYHIENDTTTIMPTEMNILLTGILWVYKSYIVTEFTPTIHSSNPWFYTESSLIQPLFSNQDHIEAIEFIRKVILIHTRLNEKLPVFSENIPSLVLLLTTELSLIHYKYCILKKECRYLDELPNVYVVLLKMVLEQTLANLISTSYKCCDLAENNLFALPIQLSTDNFGQKYKKLDIFIKSLEALLELLAYSVDDIPWISSLQLGQLINVSTSPVSYSTVGQSISENTSQPIAVSTQLKTNFGDEDFEDSTSSFVVPVEIANSQDNSSVTYLQNKLYQSVKLRIFNSLFLFGFRRKNISLLKQLYQSLQESISKIVLNDKESVKWLYKLTKNTSQSMYRIFSDKNYDCHLSSDFAELITYFISSMVDTIREMLKSLLARSNQYLRIITVVKLVRSLCMLSNSMIFMYRKLHKQSNSNLDEIGHWKLICQHIDQLIRTVWSVGAKFSRKSLQGFEVATIDCLEFWINLCSAKFIDIQSNPEYCLVLAVQHITPVATFQLAKFLQTEISPVLGKLALTDFYEPTIKLYDISIMTSSLTAHIPELVSAILIHSIMQNTDDNSKLPQWNIITELCGGSKLTRATLLKTTNVCKLIHCLLESCILYNMPIKSDETSESLPSHHYVGSILIKCLAKLYINLNFEQFVSTTQLGDTRQYYLKYAYDLMGLCPMNSDLVNRLYQVGVQFLCSRPPVNASHDLIPYCLRLTCWCAISNVMISVLFSTFSLNDYKDSEMKLVQEFSVWLFVNGHLDLLGNELTRIEHLEKLLDSLHYIFVQIRPFSIFQQNVQLLINIHHSTVYILHNLAKHLLQSEKQVQSDYSNELKQPLLQKISSILNLLVGESRCPIFNKAVYKLCELSEVNSSTCTDFSCLEEYKRYFSCLSTYNEKNFQQLLKIVSNDSELFHIVYCPQLLFYPIKMFEEMFFDMSAMFDLMPANKSVLKSDVLMQQIKSVLMKSSTEIKHTHIGLMVANVNRGEDGEGITETSSSNIVDLVISLENILNPSKSDKWFLKLLVFSDSIAKRSALHCFSVLQQVLNFRNLSNFDPIDPASMGFNYGVSVNDDFLDPMFYVKRQILSYIVSAACIPNSLTTLNSSKVLYELFSRCPSVVMSLLPQFSENHLPTFLHTILAPYIQCIDISSRSTSTRDKSTISLIGKLDPKQKAQILDSLSMLTSKLQVFLENTLTMSNNNIKLQSWLVDFVILFLESGLIQDDLFSCIKPFLQFSVELTEKLFSWLIAYCLVRFNSNNTIDKNLQQFNSTVCNGIIACLSHVASSSHSELHRFQNICLESLVAFNCFIQWIKRSRENITLNPSITINWLCAADRATVLKRPHEARLFLELAWLSDNCPNEWITTNETIHRTWVNLCRLTGDLMGLIASQTSFLSLNNSAKALKEKTSHFNVLPLLDKTKLVVHELLGNWSYLLNCYDKCYLNEEPNSSLDNSVHPKLALCLQRLGANRLFNKFSYSNNESIDLTVNKQSDITLKELRSAAAWRLSRWDNKLNDILHLDRLICPPTNWKMCGLETSFYWLLQAASQSNWFRVSEIVASQSELLIEELYSDTVQFISSDQLILCGQKIGFLNTLKQLGYHLLHANQEQCLQLTLTLLCQALNSMNFSSATYHTHDQLNVQSTLDSIEPFLTLSTSFIDVVLSKSIFPNHVQYQLRSFLIHTYLYFAEIATTSTNLSDFHLVQNWLENAINCQTFMLNLNKHFTTSLDYNWQNLKCIKLKSHLEREQGDFDLSISRLQSGLKTVNEVIEQTDKSSEYLEGYINCYIHGMTVLCNWLYESRTKSAADLLLNYINPAINLAQRLKLNPDANAFMHVAKFSDAQFTTLDSYLTSSEFATRQHFLTQAQKDVIVLSDLGEKSRLLRLLQRQSALEIDELTALTTDADHFLETAIDAYAQCLALSDDHNLLIFRFISLWLSSISSKFQGRASKINKIMLERLPRIRADKFLPLVPQLAVRLSSSCDSNSSFQSILMELIERMVDWHPHHSAFTLLFLVNAELDNDCVSNYQSAQPSGCQHPTRVNSCKASTDTGPSKSSTELSFRIQAAQQLFKRLSVGRRKELLYQMQYLTEAYVDWANADVNKYKANSGNISLPSGCKLYGLISPSLHCSPYRTMDCSLELVALPTCTFRIDRSGTYPTSDLIHVAGFSPDFHLVGGINLPKVISCLGTDGKLYRQLVKGKDDPRQDAVMQQVFTAANCLLAKHGKFNKVDLPQCSTSLVNSLKYRANWLNMDNGLRIRTYKVIPMAQRSGVIEWCEDTVPLGDWLTSERTGAHQRYRPHDMSPMQAKQRLAVVKDRTPDRKLVVFNEICEKLKPVLAYFFLEQFPSPKNWFVSRMAYIRSIAVTSIVGYLVGLGDRHPHNLLLHKSTGEIVHIDLGVAFDQGRLLPTPEMVPFRLTRDIVHALGPLGLQTGFIPAAETVLRELRRGSDVILTLLQ